MSFLDHWLLTILLLIPAAGGVIVLFLRSSASVRFTTLGLTIAVHCVLLLVAVLLRRQAGPYDYAPAGSVQMASHLEIARAIHWNYRVAVDGLSLAFLLLTSAVGVLACIASWHESDRPPAHSAMLLWTQAAALGVFLSFDLLTLWIFLTILPALVCAVIYLERGRRAARAVVTFLALMLPSIACLLVATLGVRLMSTHCLSGGTLDLVRLASYPSAGKSLGVLILVGFLLRLPVFPLHAWLPALVHEGSFATTLLVGLIPLTGAYGLLRVVFPLFPPVVIASAGWLVLLGVLLLLYSALSSIGSRHVGSATIKLWIAMSGLALAGIGSRTAGGIHGAILIVLSQALIGPAAIATSSLASGVTNSASSPRGVTVCLALAWLAELVMPGMLGGSMVLFGLCAPFEHHSGFVSNGAAGMLISMTCLGLTLFGIGGVGVLRKVSRADAPAGPEPRPVVLSVAAGAVLLALFLVPFCFAYTRAALAGMLFGAP